MQHEFSKVLIADDSKLTRGIQRSILKKAGLTQILEAADGAQAFDALQAADFEVDLVMTDWMMPNMDGLSFIRKFREHTHFQTTPVIIVSSEGTQIKVIEALKLGVATYVMKPFRRHVLVRKVQSVRTLVQLTRSLAPDQPLSGELGELAVPELIQHLATSNKSGVLHIQSNNRDARIAFCEGEIHAAAVGPMSGEQAYFESVQQNQGRFTFHEAEAMERNIFYSTLYLIYQTIKIFDAAVDKAA